MNLVIKILTTALLLVSAPSINAHHSFAVYDFEKQIPFQGEVTEFKFRNPHVSMKLAITNEDGEQQVIHFVEGAPANMLVRIGLRPDMVKAGTRLTAIGSPKKDDPSAYFLRKVILENGEEYSTGP